MAEDYEPDPVAHYTLPEQNAIELACVDRDLAEWFTKFDGKPGRRAMVSTIKAARRYIERAHHAIHAAMMIEKGGDFSQCQEDACAHLETQVVEEIPPEQFYPAFRGNVMVKAVVAYKDHAATCNLNAGVGDGKDACDCSARSRMFGWTDRDDSPLEDPELVKAEPYCATCVGWPCLCKKPCSSCGDEEASEGHPATVATVAPFRAAIERDSIDEAEKRLEGRAFVPMFGRLE